MNILVSACLVGNCTRYNKTGATTHEIVALANKHNLIPVCPEQLGGLPTPRPPAEISGSYVRTQAGCDVTDAFKCGAEETLKIARLTKCSLAILKERSPSCGKGEVYDGTFSKTLIEGHGLTAKLLLKNGIHVIGESEVAHQFPK